MELFQLKEFITLSRTLSYSEAAFMLDVSTSTLSRHIQLLENELGDKLFERTTRSISLTDFGVMYLEYAHRIFDEYDQSMRAVERYRLLASSSFRYGAVQTMEEYNISKFLIRFRQAFPEIRHELIVGTMSELERMFLEREINVYSAVPNPDVEGLIFSKFGESKIKVVVSDKNPLAKKQKVYLKELDGTPLLLHTRGSIFYNRTIDYFAKEGIHTNIIFTGEYPECIPYLREDMGIALHPFETTRAFSDEGLKIIDTVPEIMYEYGLGYRNQLSSAEKIFVDYINQFAETPGRRL